VPPPEPAVPLLLSVAPPYRLLVVAPALTTCANSPSFLYGIFLESKLFLVTISLISSSVSSLS